MTVREEIEQLAASRGYVVTWKEGRVRVNDPTNRKLVDPEYRRRVENLFVLPSVALSALREHINQRLC